MTLQKSIFEEDDFISNILNKEKIQRVDKEIQRSNIANIKQENHSFAVTKSNSNNPLSILHLL